MSTIPSVLAWAWEYMQKAGWFTGWFIPKAAMYWSDVIQRINSKEYARFTGIAWKEWRRDRH
ncbi:hypothetical protein D3C87_1795410 [compost metagenome]